MLDLGDSLKYILGMLHYDWATRLGYEITKGGCWEIRSHKPNSQDGYFRIRFRGKYERAHRASYMAHCGVIPPGAFVLHSCDNRACVNPKHLHIGSHDDNMHEAVDRERMTHKLSKEQRAAIRKDQRPVKKLAEKYGVSKQTIYDTQQRVRGRGWAGDSAGHRASALARWAS